MKQLKNIITATSILLTTSLALAGTPRIQSDFHKIVGSGRFNEPVQKSQLQITPGIYVVGEPESWGKSSSVLIVDKYVNNSDQVIAILMDREAMRDGESSIGQIFLGKPIKGGTSFMLSPMYINGDGNLVNMAEMSQRAKAIEITTRSGNEERFRYPLLMQGMNGALGGKLMGMAKVDYSNVKLSALPEGNIFELENDHQHVMVSGNTVNINTAGQLQKQFVLNPVNGDNSKLSFMSEGEYNTMGDFMTAESQVNKLAFFMETELDHKFFVTASPTMNIGDFRFEMYGKESRTLWDLIFPGHR